MKSTAGLVALARKTPDLAYASSGNGSAMHIAGELFKRSADVNMVHVPYKGAQPAVVAALGGEVRVLYMPLGGIVQHIRSGKLVPLGVAEKSRTGLMPDLPTLGEQGYKGVEVNAWYGVLAPAGTPPAVIARLNQEINAALQAADVRERLSVAGMDVVGGTPATLATEMREGYERYGKVVRDFGIRAERLRPFEGHPAPRATAPGLCVQRRHGRAGSRHNQQRGAGRRVQALDLGGVIGDHEAGQHGALSSITKRSSAERPTGKPRPASTVTRVRTA